MSENGKTISRQTAIQMLEKSQSSESGQEGSGSSTDFEALSNGELLEQLFECGVFEEGQVTEVTDS